jgi:hypothetical protein
MIEYFKPTKRTEYFFILILIIVLISSLFNFPVSSLIKPSDIEIAYRIGWPKVFFELTMTTNSAVPKLKELGFDLGFYLAIAYLLDVFMAFIIGIATMPISTNPRKEDNDEEVAILSREDAYDKAKKAYNYYKKQGIEETKIIAMFKERGWTEAYIKEIINE